MRMVIQVEEPSQAGAARRTAIQYAEQLAFTEKECGAVAIAVTEMATNLVKHARQGKIVLQSLRERLHPALRVTSMDKGPGIRDIGWAMEDGQSTAGTQGTGLGAVRRLSQQFAIYSVPETGTFITAEFWSGKGALNSDGRIRVGALSVPVKGEEACGDGWAVTELADTTLIMVVDGLGHGVHAAEAAREAERVLRESREPSPQKILLDCHYALKKTRGAAGAVAAINRERGTVSFAGVGNIGASIVSARGSRGMASHNGTIGHELHRIQELLFPWEQDSILIMHSDGVSSRWDLSRYPGLRAQEPDLIAAVVYNDFARERDDATVLIAKN